MPYSGVPARRLSFGSISRYSREAGRISVERVRLLGGRLLLWEGEGRSARNSWHSSREIVSADQLEEVLNSQND